MNNIMFDEQVDKITERELVYDIIERMSLGHDLKEGTTLFFKAKTMLTEVLKRLIANLPPSLVIYFSDIKVGIIHIKAGQKAGACTINGRVSSGTVVLAYSEQTQMDVSDCIVTSGGIDDFRCTYQTKVPFIKDEYVKVYVR